MLIKKVTVNWDNSSHYSEVRILFYDKMSIITFNKNFSRHNITSYLECATDIFLIIGVFSSLLVFIFTKILRPFPLYN